MYGHMYVCNVYKYFLYVMYVYVCVCVYFSKILLAKYL